MTVIDDYLTGIEKHELSELRKQLEPLEKQKMVLRSRRPGAMGRWTQDWIEHLKRPFRIYEEMSYAASVL